MHMPWGQWALGLLLCGLFALLVGTMTRLWVKTTSRSAVDGRSLALSPTDARAKELMRDLLDEREYIQVMECGHLDVLSPSQAQRIYRIPLSGGRVRVFERGTAVHELCIQP